MKISVWDTYIKREDNGSIMHFDILVPAALTEEQAVFNYGKLYLRDKPFTTKKLSLEECQFCHIEQATEEMISSISEKGFAIIELENCT